MNNVSANRGCSCVSVGWKERWSREDAFLLDLSLDLSRKPRPRRSSKSLTDGSVDPDPDAVDDLRAISQRINSKSGSLDLNLKSRRLGESGARAVAACVQPNLTSLSFNFTSCNINDAGAQAVAESLPASLKILSLTFTGCVRLQEAGARAVAARVPGGLRSLSLDFALCTILRC